MPQLLEVISRGGPSIVSGALFVKISSGAVVLNLLAMSLFQGLKNPFTGVAWDRWKTDIYMMAHSRSHHATVRK